MKIKKLEYYDQEYQWQLHSVEFLQDINLIVGVSGAGKTRILQSIRNLKKIANGASLNGVKWNVYFSTENNIEYHWNGEFETKENTSPIDNDFEKTENNVKILYENLICNENIIVKRTKEEIFFNGVKTPKLSPFESIIELLKEEDSIIAVKKELDKIILIDSDRDFGEIWLLPLSTFKKYENSSFLTLKESNLSVIIKLAIIYRIMPENFERIKKSFISIFKNVSDIKLEPLTNDDIPIALSTLLKEAIKVSIKEKGVEKWINNISSGMFKTLMYISELYLCPDNCVILIDEFENSLGVNCIDSVTDLIKTNQNSQFIITSHHPYIINNIQPKNWKIVTRQGSLVTVKNAKDFHISESRQKAFIDLINVLEDEENEED